MDVGDVMIFTRKEFVGKITKEGQVKIASVWLFMVLIIIMIVLQAGCATAHGVRAFGPTSYYYGKTIADIHVQKAVSKGELIEVKYDNGSVKAGFNLLNLEGWKEMTWLEKLGYTGTVAIDGVAGYYGYDFVRDEIKDRDNKNSDHVDYANAGDSIVAGNSGSGDVDITYEVQAGGSRPANVYTANSGSGNVHVTIKECPEEK
jgi:hypothetical protein